MKVVFCGFQSAALEAVDLLQQRGWDVLPVVGNYREPLWGEQPRFRDGLRQRDLPLVTQDQLIEVLSSDMRPHAWASYLDRRVDLLISYLFCERVAEPLLSWPSIGAINFHPGPLPEYGGAACYNFAILEKRKTYGVTAHFMDESFDTGDIILRKDFPLRWRTTTARELRQTATRNLLELLNEVVARVESGAALPRVPQRNTRLTTLKQAEVARRITADDLQSRSQLDLKARAFWDPPNDGAGIEVDGTQFTIVPRHELRQWTSPRQAVDPAEKDSRPKAPKDIDKLAQHAHLLFQPR